MTAIGIDSGSLTTKVVVLEGRTILATALTASGDDAETAARETVAKALADAGRQNENHISIVTTGISGKYLSISHQQKAVTTCLGRGISLLFPSVRMVIDIGAETSTVVKLNERGRVIDWANQDKCAAGTGLFLQQMSRLMQVSFEDMSALSLQAKAKADITSTCAVFAESEVISHIHRDPPTPKPDIIAGIYASVISRLMAMCKRVSIERDIAVTGGVALNRGLVAMLEKELKCNVLVPDKPEFTAALGAAIIARENAERGSLR
jgi:predicted CoA-substrate-specific enzyme activase